MFWASSLAECFRSLFDLLWLQVHGSAEAVGRSRKKQKKVDMFLMSVYVESAGMMPNKLLGALGV